VVRLCIRSGRREWDIFVLCTDILGTDDEFTDPDGHQNHHSCSRPNGTSMPATGPCAALDIRREVTETTESVYPNCVAASAVAHTTTEPGRRATT
jgi:hypothetical protein